MRCEGVYATMRRHDQTWTQSLDELFLVQPRIVCFPVGVPSPPTSLSCQYLHLVLSISLSLNTMNMADTRSITTIERALGFAYERGISRQGRRQLASEVVELLEGLDSINRRYGRMLPRKMKTSNRLRRAARTLFDELGSRLWPPTSARKNASWLVDADKPRDDRDLYPRNLYFEVARDRAM